MRSIKTGFIIISLLVLTPKPAFAQLKADQFRGTDAFDQISKALVALNSSEGIIDATNMKGSSAVLNVSPLAINQSNVKITLGAATYNGFSSGATPMIAIGNTASVTNVDIRGQGDNATIINCSTSDTPCITIGAGAGTASLVIGHIHIHDLTIVGTTTTMGDANIHQDCILISPPMRETTLNRIDSIEIDRVHFENCGHSNIDAWGVTNLRIHDNTFDASGWAGMAFPIIAPCIPNVSNATMGFTTLNNYGTSGRLIRVTTTAPVNPMVGDYVYINTNLTPPNLGAFKIIDAISPSSYDIMTNLPNPTALGFSQLETCDNGIWIENNVMNDYGVSVDQMTTLGTVAGIDLTFGTDPFPMTAVPLHEGIVSAFTNIHIRNNIIKCLSDNLTGTYGQNNKLTVRPNAIADSEISGNNLIACSGEDVSGENIATEAYHVSFTNNDFWNSSSTGAACLSVNEQNDVSLTDACPNASCGSQGLIIQGNRFHNCNKANIYWLVTEDGALIADNEISDNIGDDSGTGLVTYGFAFTNAGLGCPSMHDGCAATIVRSHVHDNIWGDLPGNPVGAVASAGDGVNIEIGTGGYPHANVTYKTVITGGFDFWGNNSISVAMPLVQDSGFYRRSLKDIYCATDQNISGGMGDPDCDNFASPNMTANSDYGGQGALSAGTFQFTHFWSGTYSTPPICVATDTGTPPTKLMVTTTLATLIVTGTNTHTIDYTCQPLSTHN